MLESASAQLGEDALYYRQVLHGLIDIGADIARMVHEQVKVQAAAAEAGGAVDGGLGAAAPDASVVFDRVARAVRRTIALARVVAEPLPSRGAGPRRVAARKQIIRAVEDTIERTVWGRDAESLHAELVERLDAPELDDEIDDRPVADIIADICRDLGLAALPGTQPWKRRTPEDIAALCALAAKPRGGVARAGNAAAAEAGAWEAEAWDAEPWEAEACEAGACDTRVGAVEVVAVGAAGGGTDMSAVAAVRGRWAGRDPPLGGR